MAKGFTYKFIDKNGFECSRYSAGHKTPRYTHAAVAHQVGVEQKQPRKSRVSFSTSEVGAIAARRDYKGLNPLYGVWDVVTYFVTAIPGRA